MIFATVSVSDFGMMSETENFGVPPLIDFGFPNIGIRPAGVGTGDDLHWIAVDFVCVI